MHLPEMGIRYRADEYPHKLIELTASGSVSMILFCISLLKIMRYGLYDQVTKALLQELGSGITVQWVKDGRKIGIKQQIFQNKSCELIKGFTERNL